MVKLAWPKPRKTRTGFSAEVVSVDRFGNLITNIDQGVLDRCGEHVAIEIAGHVLPRLVGTYADVASGAICAASVPLRLSYRRPARTDSSSVNARFSLQFASNSNSEL
jgi:S-adenosylmethionine hydrolase